jgi:hypothetical protein
MIDEVLSIRWRFEQPPVGCDTLRVLLSNGMTATGTPMFQDGQLKGWVVVSDCRGGPVVVAWAPLCTVH